MSVVSRALRGLVAGAAGTTVLDAVTYLDMALTGRPSSGAPAETVLAGAEAVGVELRTDGGRDEAFGALAGIAVGSGIGAVAALVRGTGVRLPLLAEAAVIGVGAMAATDGPMAVLDSTDVTSWSTTDWARDVVPHLAYGVAVAGTLRTMEPREPRDEPRPGAATPPTAPSRLLLRSLAIGIATGARSSLGLVPPGMAAGRLPTAAALGLVGAELVIDKRASTPSRLGGPTVARVASAATGAAVLARRAGASGVLPAAAAGALGAVAGSIGGAIWRELCAERSWAGPGAVVEDVASVALTAYAVKA